jgi:hypothetical protein
LHSIIEDVLVSRYGGGVDVLSPVLALRGVARIARLWMT